MQDPSKNKSLNHFEFYLGRNFTKIILQHKIDDVFFSWNTFFCKCISALCFVPALLIVFQTLGHFRATKH